MLGHTTARRTGLPDGAQNHHGEQSRRSHSESIHRQQRKQRIAWAWATSLPSKLATLGVQLIGVPLVYHALGEAGYASYAAVTTSASLIWVLNLGIGGSLVTPLATAVAESDQRKQAVLVRAGLIPLVCLCLIGMLLILPVIAVLPLSTMFGKAVAAGAPDLRIAALIAGGATLLSVPLSSGGYLRQAYQEIHITNLIGAAANIVLLAALVLAARWSHALSVFVSIFVLIPLLSLAINLGSLLWQRGFLLKRLDGGTHSQSRGLMTDGIRFLGASLCNVLLFQWPVYWVARSLPASASSWFAICIQATVLPMGLFVSVLQPLWSSTAEAVFRTDYMWINNQIRKGRTAIIILGSIAFTLFLIFGEQMLSAWLRKSAHVSMGIRALIGGYLFLGIWEQFYLVIALGFGKLRQATRLQFQRSAVYAVGVPVLCALGGIPALWIGMCCSIVFWSGWRLPKLIKVSVSEKTLDCSGYKRVLG